MPPKPGPSRLPGSTANLLSACRPVRRVGLAVLLGAFCAGGGAAQDQLSFRKPQFLRGDANADAVVDIADALFGLVYLFADDVRPACQAALDSNGDGGLDVTDPIALLNFLFLGGPPLATPGSSECGVDPQEGGLPCDAYPHCPDDLPLIAHVLGRITFGGTEELYRSIQTRKDLVRYIEDQLQVPAGYDPRRDEPALFARVEGLRIGHEGGGNAAEQIARLKASLLVHAVGSRWQLLQVITQFWENHFHTQIDALAENFFQRGGVGGPALRANERVFSAADQDLDGLISEVEWTSFQTVHPGLITWNEFGRPITDGKLTLDEFLGRQQIAYWKYPNGSAVVGISGEMERRENDFFRARALGAFRDLLEGSAKGVPMLIYLNGFENTAQSPNENYARELLELFSLGVDHLYTQRDIQEVARLLTGRSVGWVERAPFDPVLDPQYILHPELPEFPIDLREPRPISSPTRQFWDDDLYTWASVIRMGDHDWGRKDLFLAQFGGTDSLGNPPAASDRLQIPDNTQSRTVASVEDEFDRLLDRLVAFRDCRKFICGKLIQLFVTDELDDLSREGPPPPEVEGAFRRIDLDSSGAIERSEWEEPVPLVLPNGRPPEVFEGLDRDGDGKLTPAEYREPDLLLAAMKRWEETGGSIREVLRVILLSEDFLSLKFQQAKVKTPLEQVTSTLRVLNATASDGQLKMATQDMSNAGMDLFHFADPTGESEFGFDWLHTIGLLERIKWISRGVNPESPDQRRFAWSPPSFIQRYRLSSRERLAGFFALLLHPNGIRENDRLLALKAYDEAPSAKVEAMVAFLLSIPPAMKQ